MRNAIQSGGVEREREWETMTAIRHTLGGRRQGFINGVDGNQKIKNQDEKDEN